MVDYKKADLASIVADAMENDRVDFLKSLGKKTYPKKDGGKRKISFIEIKKLYYSQYYPSMIPSAKNKKQSMYEILEKL